MERAALAPAEPSGVLRPGAFCSAYGRPRRVCTQYWATADAFHELQSGGPNSRRLRFDAPAPARRGRGAHRGYGGECERTPCATACMSFQERSHRRVHRVRSHVLRARANDINELRGAACASLAGARLRARPLFGVTDSLEAFIDGAIAALV